MYTVFKSFNSSNVCRYLKKKKFKKIKIFKYLYIYEYSQNISKIILCVFNECIKMFGQNVECL